MNYRMLSRGKCFNAVFFPNGSIREFVKPGETIKPLKYNELIAGVKRKLFLLGIPLFCKNPTEPCDVRVWIDPNPPNPTPPDGWVLEHLAKVMA